MKRKFTILTAALALLAFLAIPMGMWADEAQYVFNTDAGIAALGISKPSTGAGTSLSTTTPYTVGQISMSVTHGSTDTRVWNSNGTLDLRIYKSGGSLTFAAASGYNITGITIAGSAVGNFSVNSGTYSSGSWSNGTTGASSVTFTATNTGKINTITVTYSASGSTLQASDLALVDAPVELEFDLYDNANAQTISYTTSSTGAVTVNQSNYITATVNANNTITVTPVAVTNGPQTITVNQAADNTYAAGSVTFTVDIEDSTPSTGSDVTFDATVDKDLNNTTQGEGSIVKNGVTFTCSDGILGNGTEYRLYKNSTTTFSVESGTITQIVFTCTSGNPASGFATQTGWTTNGSNGTWTGNATSVSFVASSKQVRATQIVVTVETSGTPDPTISADNVDIAYSATSGSITYTINNEPSPAGTLTATVTEGNWLTLGQGTTSPIAFTCTANENTTARTATVTLTYTYNTDQTVSANVTVTQAAAPVIYSTIPALFAAATSTETNVLVTFNNWVVSGVSTNGKNVFVTDNNGNGFVIFNNNGGLDQTYSVGNILSGTAVSCTLKKYNGFAELLNVDANDLTITTGGTVTVANVAMADLAGVNTGALLHYDNLTCSVDDNKYYLSDGTTTLQVYNSLYAFDALEDGKTYNITGIYQQYNSTKEILPRSAADIEEVVMASVTVTPNTINAPAEGAEGNLALAYENITDFFSFDFYFCDANGGELQEDPDWIYAEINPGDDDTYVLDYLIYANNGEARTAYMKVYTFDDDEEEVYAIVTVNQAEYVAPSCSKYVKVTSTADLTDGQYLIVYEDGGLAFDGSLETLDAVGNTITVTINNNEIAVTETTSASEFTINTTAGTIKSASGYYIGQTSDANGLQANQETEYTNTISFEEGDANIVSSGGAYLRYNNASNQSRFRYFKSSTYTGQKAIQLYKKVYNLDITGYGTSAGGYYLIASPVTVNPANVEGMTEGHFDLFRFNESADYEWENWKVDGDHYHFDLIPGQGYLYAHKTDVTLTFTGTPYNGEPIILSKTDGNGIDWPGWNLVGNPYGVMAYLDRDFYTMNDAGDEIVAATNNSVQAMEGVFVIANSDGEELTFSTEAPAESGKKIVVNVSNTNGALLDRAMIRFGEGGQLPKFQINENSTKLYINEGEEEFAVVRCINESSTPVSFRAAENGTYTLSINTENVEMEYLHLIDNLTGADIDLLATPSYTFESNTTDNADRFAVVYTATTSVNENNVKPFAFFNGSEWVIMNEGNATMQVVDVTGRVISTETLNGNATINLIQVPGVYMFRLVNGNDVKVQKVVVK